MNRHQENYLAIAHKFLHLANRGIPKFDFFQQILTDLMDFSGCHIVELWVYEDGFFTRTSLETGSAYRFETLVAQKETIHYVPELPQNNQLDTLRVQIFTDQLKRKSEFLTRSGNLYSGDIRQEYGIHNAFRSLALIRIFFGDEKSACWN
jgi:hypothetical protein